MIKQQSSDESRSFDWPLHGAANPSTEAQGTSPGSFANRAEIGSPLTFSSPDTPGMPSPSEKTAWDFLPADWSIHAVESHEEGCAGHGRSGGAFIRCVAPDGFKPITQLEHARLGIVTPEARRVAEREGYLTPEQVRDEVAAGRMVIPANTVHLEHHLDPMAIGRASKTKINANMGASPVSSSTDEEVEKLKWAERWGADTVMDLSTGGDLDATREAIITNSTVPIGTVPIYSMIIGRKIEDLDEPMILDMVDHQARQGVDYFTIHAGTLREHLPFVKERLIGIVSRGGSLLAKWMIHHGEQNPMNDRMGTKICAVMRRYDVTFSIGDGLRPGGLADASDAAQFAELQALGELTETRMALRGAGHGRGPGPRSLRPGRVQHEARADGSVTGLRSTCSARSLPTSSPATTTSPPASVRPQLRTTALRCSATSHQRNTSDCPKRDDVKQGCIAYKIAAHAADVALGIPGTRDCDDELTKARAALNWEKHFELSFDPDTARAFHDEDLDVDTDFCAMCGHDWCSVRISKEIQEFASGKDPEYFRDKPVRSDALTPEQQEILEKRGVLSPEEIHALASKTRKDLGAEHGKGSCHSDYVDPDGAKALQDEKIVQLNTAPAHNLPSHDPLI